MLSNSRLIHAKSILATFLTGICALLFAPELVLAQTEQTSSLNNEQRTLQQLIDALPHQNIVWLDTEKSGIGRYDVAIDPFQMVVLVLSEHNQRLDSPELISTMHEQLPLFGWNILSIALPVEAPTTNGMSQASRAEDTSGSNAQTSGSEAGDSSPTPSPDIKTSDKTNQRLDAAISFLKQQQTKSIAIFASEKRLQEAFDTAIKHKEFVSGLVLWQAEEISYSPEDLKQLSDSKVSILDIAPMALNNTQMALRKKHFAQAGIQQHYRLISLPEHAPLESSVKRIRQWLKSEFRLR